MEPGLFVLAFVLFFTIAVLYSSVGHAGASGYLAIMAFLSLAPESIKPTSLILNIVVAMIASVKFIRAGYFEKRLFFYFIITSLPMAFIGGYITVNPHYFKLLAGVFLVVSAVLLVVKSYLKPSIKPLKPMPLGYGLLIGSVIGLISGLIGVGGGVFLSPILILGNWTHVKNASGIAALFILLNSAAGLSGHLAAVNRVDAQIFYWVAAVMMGGLLGSHLGTRKFNNKLVLALLFVVLLSAGLKFILVDGL
jgi:hypothetical protein